MLARGASCTSIVLRCLRRQNSNECSDFTCQEYSLTTTNVSAKLVCNIFRSIPWRMRLFDTSSNIYMNVNILTPLCFGSRRSFRQLMAAPSLMNRVARTTPCTIKILSPSVVHCLLVAVLLPSYRPCPSNVC